MDTYTCLRHGRYSATPDGTSIECPQCYLERTSHHAFTQADMQEKAEAKAQERKAEELTLRDRFAMAALTGICATMPREDVFDMWKGIKGGAMEAKAAYDLADKMLQARKEKG